MNTYIQTTAKAISNTLGIKNDEDEDLYLLYAMLCLTKGKNTTLQDVHEAWGVWKHLRGLHDHKSLIPFDELKEEIQELDRPYMNAIRDCALN